MASKEYDYECMRADLLGLPKPDINSLPSNQPKEEEEDSAGIENDLNLIAAELQDSETGAQLKDQSTRPIDQVQDILALTQKKLTTLKMGIGNVGSGFSTSLGSFTTYIKQRVGGETSSTSETPEDSAPVHSAEAP